MDTGINCESRRCFLFKRKVWVDQERYVPMQEELFAKSGQLLKRTVMSEVTKMGNRWYPKK